MPVAPPTMWRRWICVVESSVKSSVRMFAARRRATHVASCAGPLHDTLYSTAASALSLMRYLNSVKLTSVPTSSTKRLNDPLVSGMMLSSVASVLDPESASCDTTRRRSKFMLAPDVMATTLPVTPCALQYALAPATATAPAGSRIDRFSLKTSLMAAQIWSVRTVMTPSTSCWHRSKLTSPGWRTATPSANPSTLVNRHTSPWYSD
mmetsp:Transcript_10581/g.16928  ORF Transcript_10581/g.16928 Transcript_10581/m.16928 type:complete len:207 (-) Transcript_10581:1452-2072(-)